MNRLDVVRASDILGIECFQINSAKKVGKVVDINYSTQSGNIESIVIKTLQKIENKKQISINFGNIVAIGDIMLIEFDI